MKDSNTKTQLANAFKKLAKEKSISKITVKDIITECNVNRKTFYYHFEDICDLFKWIHEEGAFSYVNKVDLISDHEEVIQFVIDYLNANKKLLNSAYDAFSQEGLKRIFHGDFLHITKKLVDSVESNLKITVNSEFKSFVVKFYVDAIASFTVTWFRSNETYNDEVVVHYIRSIFKSSIPAILLNGPNY